ncbi:MAG: hypothetical protein WBA39_33945 [Rivularia sp. (in: cyanobacteria)]
MVKDLAYLLQDGTVKLWDINNSREIKTFEGYTERIIRVSFSADGKIFASVSEDGKITLWNIKSGREIKTLKGHVGQVRNVSFSPDGKILASASGDFIATAKAVKTQNVKYAQ